MDIEQKYLYILENLESIAAKRKSSRRYPAMGLTSNLDLLCDFSTDTLSRLLEEHLPDGRLGEMRPAKIIRSMKELLETIVYFCVNGIGGEVDIENTGVMNDSFHWKHGMGGTAVQAALALQSIGCPSVVHLTDDSREVCSLLDHPEIFVVSPDGHLVHTGEVHQTQDQEIHAIIQFRKGDVIRLGSQEAVIPLSNRLILTKVTVNETVPFYEPYFRYIVQHADQISSYVISSFNCLSDAALLKDRLEYTKAHIGQYKSANPDGIVYFEDAHYHSKEIRSMCMDILYPCVDIVSLNEEELGSTMEDWGASLDLDDIQSVVNSVNLLRKRYKMKKGVIVHTKDYSMYVGEALSADIEAGLIYGNLMAGAKALYGWYGTAEQIRSLSVYPLSQKGEEFRRKAAGASWGSGVTIVPTRFMDRPPYTIGLGDSFTAGVQMCFL